MRHLLALVLLIEFSSCSPTDAPAVPEPFPEEQLRYSLEDGASGRILTAGWYHVSFSGPLASTTLAEREFGEAFELSSPTGTLMLPERLDSIFEFWARFRDYASNEAKGGIRPSLLDSASVLQSRHWAIAPLFIARTKDVASRRFGDTSEPGMDSTLRYSEHLLLWVRDSLDASEEPILSRRHLSARLPRGWHLLRYDDSNRSLVPTSFADTIRFRATTPKPNLV